MRGWCPQGRAGSSPAFDTKKREISRDDFSEEIGLLEVCVVPGQVAENSVAECVFEDQPQIINAMKSATKLAPIKQQERLVALLRPVLNQTVTSVASQLPLAVVPVRHSPSGPLSHGFARIDQCGRFRDAQLFTQLGWNSGDNLAFQVHGEQIIIRKGACTDAVDSRGRVQLSRTLRRLIGISSNDTVLLSADVFAGTLLISPTRLCDQLASL